MMDDVRRPDDENPGTPTDSSDTTPGISQTAIDEAVAEHKAALAAITDAQKRLKRAEDVIASLEGRVEQAEADEQALRQYFALKIKAVKADATAALGRDILAVLEDYAPAIRNIPDAASDEFRNYATGIHGLEAAILATLRLHGIEPGMNAGPVDVSEEPAPTLAPEPGKQTAAAPEAPAEDEAAADDFTAPTNTAEVVKLRLETRKLNRELERLKKQVAEPETRAAMLQTRFRDAVTERDKLHARHEREMVDATALATRKLAKDLIKDMDVVALALQDYNMPKQMTDESRAYLDDVRKLEAALIETLAKHGIEEIEVKIGDKFDPNVHEAVFHVQSPQVPGGHIMAPQMRGYRLNGRLLRAPTVGVSAGGPS